MASDRQAVLQAAAKYGPSLDHIASRYINPVTGKRLTGAALLAKVVSGESSFNRDSVSSVGARGLAQFMPGSRAVAISRFGVDPWRSADEAVHAAALHLRGKINGSTGLEGYNPGGGQTYVDYILRQKVGSLPGHGAGGGGRRSGGGSTRPAVTTSSGAGSTVVASSPDLTPVSLADKLTAQQEQLVAPEITMPALPAFAAKPVLPKGYTPLEAGAPPAAQPQLEIPSVSVDSSLPADQASAASRAAGGGGGGGGAGAGYPAARRGKIIGVPHQGTHTLGNWQSDNAVDIQIPTGTKILAVADGVVEKVHGSYHGGASRFDGYQITVRLADGRQVFYTHLSKNAVKPGQRLRAGQVIGRSGAANGVQHLHFAIDKGDPRNLLLGGGRSAGAGASSPGGSAGGGLRSGNLVGAVHALERLTGLPVTARQEPGHAPGGDHDPAVKGATARDFGGDEVARKEAFLKLTRALGVRGAVYKGADINVTVNGIRYQIISRDHGTGPHLHVGMRLAR